MARRSVSARVLLRWSCILVAGLLVTSFLLPSVSVAGLGNYEAPWAQDRAGSPSSTIDDFDGEPELPSIGTDESTNRSYIDHLIGDRWLEVLMSHFDHPATPTEHPDDGGDDTDDDPEGEPEKPSSGDPQKSPENDSENDSRDGDWGGWEDDRDDDSKGDTDDRDDDNDSGDAGDDTDDRDDDDDDRDAGDDDGDRNDDDDDDTDDGENDTDEFERSYEVDVERAIHEEINEIRADHDLEPLEYDDRIAAIALGHSEDMASAGYFSHTAPDGSTVGDRYDEAGISCRAWGENLLYNYHSDESPDVVAERSVEQWMNSDGHRENVLADQWESQGIGVAIADDGRLYATQNFGTDCE